MNGVPLMDYQSVLSALASLPGGAALVPYGVSGGFSSVALDSRKAESGSLFAAFKGMNSDGHRYINEVFQKGASAALVTRGGLREAGFDLCGFQENAENGRALVIVEDTLAALQALAAAYLDKFPSLVRIGITGSSGKTTTKEIAAAMIGCEKEVVSNEGNLNSETGLPLSVFAVRNKHRVGIFEAGMNRKGEIASLASVLRPSIALVTNIGPAHIGIFGSMDAITLEKKQIFSRFTGKETALIPRNDPFSDLLSRGIRGNTVLYGRESFEALGLLGAIRDKGLAGTEIVWEGIPVFFGLPGAHNVKNALAAAALARELHISGDSIRQGLSSVKPLFGRGEILAGKTTVIRDCYNANPDSVAQALTFCDGLEWKGRKIYVLGSMLEQGEHSEEAHGNLGKLLAESKGDKVFLYGKEIFPAAEVLAGKKVPYFFTDTMSELKKELSGFIQNGDLVLLKGSRGCALEEVSDLVFLGGGTE